MNALINLPGSSKTPEHNAGPASDFEIISARKQVMQQGAANVRNQQIIENSLQTTVANKITQRTVETQFVPTNAENIPRNEPKSIENTQVYDSFNFPENAFVNAERTLLSQNKSLDNSTPPTPTKSLTCSRYKIMLRQVMLTKKV